MIEHAVAQTGLLGLQIAHAAQPFVPFPWSIAVAGGVGIIQGLLALHHHGIGPVAKSVPVVPAGKPPMSVR
jgi:hypothetical protein